MALQGLISDGSGWHRDGQIISEVGGVGMETIRSQQARESRVRKPSKLAPGCCAKRPGRKPSGTTHN